MREALAEARLAVGRTHPNPAVGAVVVPRRARSSAADTPRPPAGPTPRCGPSPTPGRAREAPTSSRRSSPAITTGGPRPAPRPSSAPASRGCSPARRIRTRSSTVAGCAGCGAPGMPVWTGVLAAETDALNRPFFKAMRVGLPWVTLKAAVSLDGKLATASGDSRWVTGEAARTEVHRLRNVVDAVLVGAGTVRADDPSLTTRLPEGGGRDPLRVMLASSAHLSPQRQLFHLTSSAQTLVVHVEGQGRERSAALAATGAELLAVPGRPGEVDLEATLRGVAPARRAARAGGGGPRALLGVPPRGAGGFAGAAPGAQAGGRGRALLARSARGGSDGRHPRGQGRVGPVTGRGSRDPGPARTALARRGLDRRWGVLTPGHGR